MPKLALKQLPHLNTVDPTGITLSIVKQVEMAINNLGAQLAASPVGVQAPPPQIAAVSAEAFAPGIHKVTIQDNSPVQRGVWYHYEASTTPEFRVGTTILSGTSQSRVHFASLGTGPVFWRAYSQYQASAPSDPVAAPAAIDAGGGARTGTFSGTGSGTEGSIQAQPGAGFGFNPDRPMILT